MKNFEERALARDLVDSDKFLKKSSNYAKFSQGGEFDLQQMLVKLILSNAEEGEFRSTPATTLKWECFTALPMQLNCQKNKALAYWISNQRVPSSNPVQTKKFILFNYLMECKE